MEGWTDEDERQFVEMKQRRGESSKELSKKKASASLRDLANRIDSGESVNWRVSVEPLYYEHVWDRVVRASLITIEMPVEVKKL